MVKGQEKATAMFLEGTLLFGSKKHEENPAKENIMVVGKPRECDDCFKKREMIHCVWCHY